MSESYISATNIEFRNAATWSRPAKPEVLVSFTIDISMMEIQVDALGRPRVRQDRPVGLDLYTPIYEWLQKNKAILKDAEVTQPAAGGRKLLLPGPINKTKT